jgi:single-stranded-DNA-specific exonuclease
MQKTVDRILKAVESNENILIFSDYDTDGIPGGAIMYNFFKKIEYKHFQNYIPNRNRDGYGLTESAAKKIVTGNIFTDSLFGETESKLNPLEGEEFSPTLVITIDCGITDIVASKILKKAKIDLIITDHHLPKSTLPDAYAILDHKVETENYPDKNLCGAGVIFKVVQALVKTMQEHSAIVQAGDVKKEGDTKAPSQMKNVPAVTVPQDGWEK